MKRVIFLLSVLSVLLPVFEASGQNIYRSRTTGNWNSPTTWEYSSNGGTTWIPSVSTFPTADSAGSVTIQSPHNVTVPSGVTIPIDQLTLAGGSTVTLASTSTLEVRNGSGTDLNVSTATMTGTGTLRANGSGALFTINNASVVSCAVKISADVTVYDPGFPNTTVLYGSVTIDNGASISTQPGGFTTRFQGAVTNNGTIATGNSSGGNDFRGSSLVNNGAISSYNVSVSDTVLVSGAGSWSSVNLSVTTGGLFKLASNVTIGTSSVASVEIGNGGRLETNNFLLTIDGTTGAKTFRMTNGSTSGTLGEVNTKGTVTIDLQTGCFFDIVLRVNDGVTNTYCSPFPNVAIYNNEVIIEAAGNMRTVAGGFNSRFLDRVTNNGTMSTGNSSGNFEFAGIQFINNNLINAYNVSFTDTTEVSGAGNWSSINVTIQNGGLMKLTGNVTIGTSSNSEFIINAGGRLDMNSFTLTFNGSTGNKTLTMNNGSFTGSLGNVNTTGAVTLNLLNTASFSTRLRVLSGVTTVYSSNFPNTGYFYNEIIIEPPGNLRVLAGGYNMIATANVVNNGIISGGNTSSRFTLSGAAFTNNGNISIHNLSIDGVINHLGTGTFSSPDAEITSGSMLNLLDDMRFGLSGSQTFTCRSGSSLNLNGKKFIVDGSNGGVTLRQIGTSEISDSGSVDFYGSTGLDLYTNSNCLAPINVKTGTTSIYNSIFPNTMFLTNTIAVDTGAVFTILAGGYTLYSYGTINNNGTIATGNTSGTYRYFGDDLVNNGTISAYNFLFESVPASATQVCRLSGTGAFTSANLQILEGTFVQLASNHIMGNILVNSGSTFDITSRVLKLTSGGSPMTINGSLITGGSTIEYGGTTGQSTVHTGVNYANMTINNPAGVTLSQNFNIPGLLRVTLGTLNLNGKVITFLPTANLIETPGNVISGTSGYIVTTRSINAPSSLNVSGFGATITSSANFGLTEVRRGHTAQTIPGGQSVKRYYVIRPENNTGLNATCVFKYDDTELNGNVEANLKMLKSTNAGSTYLTGGGTVNTTQNTVTVTEINDFARHTFGPGTAIANIILSPEGLYNTSTQKLNLRDTVKIQLRNMNSPYAVVDSSKSVIDSVTLTVQALFPNAPNGNYYIVVKHRNTIETWSSLPQVYNTEASLLYNFTSAQNQAFGDNMRLKGTRWVFYSGDVNQDGSVDATDVQAIDNDATNFVSGYVPTDLNGDGFVDGSDFTIGDNNAFNFVGVIRP